MQTAMLLDAQQLPLAIHLNQEINFKDFYFGDNQVLEHQIDKILNGIGERFIYLWGEEATGKSHILQACCNALSQLQTVVYLPMSVLSDFNKLLLEDIETSALICIDDIEAIAGNREWEEALLHFYNRVRSNEKSHLIITSKVPPAYSPISLADLRSRLSWGLVFKLNPLNDQAKVDLLPIFARKRGMVLSRSVSQFIIRHCGRNMNELQQLLQLLDVASLSAQRRITIPFIKSVIKAKL